MAAWSGWRKDLLTRLGVQETTANLTFLADWHSYEKTPCKNNPLSAHHKYLGSTLCQGGPKRNYLTHSDGAHATSQQLHDAKFAPILLALESGDPFTYPDNLGVVNALTDWGSIGFANSYGLASSAPKAPPAGIAPHTLGGWKDLRRSINRNMPHALNHSRRTVHAAIRSLSHAHRL